MRVEEQPMDTHCVWPGYSATFWASQGYLLQVAFVPPIIASAGFDANVRHMNAKAGSQTYRVRNDAPCVIASVHSAVTLRCRWYIGEPPDLKSFRIHADFVRMPK